MANRRVAVSESGRYLESPSPRDKSGIIVSGRGFDVIPRDPNYPDEIPRQTVRRLEQGAINRNPQGDSLRRVAEVRDEFGDPTAAQFPVSAATKTPLYNDGYGAGYTKSPLDPGYQASAPVAGDAPPPNAAPPSVRTVAPLPAPSSTDPTATPIDPLDVRSTAPAIPVLSSMKAPPPMIERNNKGRPVSIVGGDDPVANNMALIRSQEAYKAPRSTKDQILSLLTGGIPGAIDYATNQNTRNRWATGQDIADEEGQIQRELGVQGKQASIDAAKWRPVYQQQQAAARAGAQDEKEINDALSQYNRLETYDPDDPAQAGLKNYFESHGIKLPAKDKYHRPIATWANGQLLLTDASGTHNATVDRQNVSDKGRTPNEAGLTPNQQAEITARTSEGQKNREAAMARTKVIADAVANRQQKQIDLEIAKMGDPQEMYATASDLWQQGVDKENQAKSMAVRTTADAETKKQLLADAAKLKETTVKIQQEAGKARSAGRGARSALKGRTMSQQNFDRYKKDHGEAAAQELINGGVTIRN